MFPVLSVISLVPITFRGSRDIGGKVLASEENPNSKRGKGEVTKRRKWTTISAEIRRKNLSRKCSEDE